MQESAAHVDASAYGAALAEYLNTRGEAALYQASLLSRSFVQERIGPEDIVALHVEAMHEVARALPLRSQRYAATDGLHFLLEVMIAYGVQHKEYLELRLRELAQSEADKGEVLAIIAHELRTPITAAKGSIDLAERSLARGEFERLNPLLGRSREAVDRLAKLTRDLLDASRGTTPDLRFDRHDIAALVAQAVDWASVVAAEQEVHLEHATAGTAAEVVGDAGAVVSLLGNLLSNAIRYTPSGGQVIVRHGVSGAEAWVEVADTGIGMSPEVQARVFEKFYRAPEAARLASQGLGLGLTLVRQLVDAHHGRIELQSGPGQGTTFRVFLPTPEEVA